jgi:hypothetical protein
VAEKDRELAREIIGIIDAAGVKARESSEG